MMFKQGLIRIYKDPRKLFLMDAAVALLTAFMLGVVLVELEHVFGIPRSTLYILASLPCVFAVYDFYCYYNAKEKVAVFLVGLACINVLYCCLTLGFVFYHKDVITGVGLAYILNEIFYVLYIAVFQYRTAQRVKRYSKPLV